MANFLQDLRFSVRLIRRTPGFALAIVATLALGVGVTTAMFTVVYATLLKPLPFSDPQRLALTLEGRSPSEAEVLSYTDLRDWQNSGAFENVAGYFRWNPTVTDLGDADIIRGLRVTASLLPLLGIEPALGRHFTVEDERRGSEPVVMISHAFWLARFGGDDQVLSKRLILNDQRWTIVGVLPRSFTVLRPADGAIDAIAPLRLNDENAPASLHFITAIARLKPGTDVTQTQERLVETLRQRYPDVQPQPAAVVMPLQEALVGRSQPILLALFGAVACVLLIACANLANLTMARASGRRHEMAVRRAIGASRWRIAQQWLTESLTLSMLGGAAGLFLAFLLVRLISESQVVARAGAYGLTVDAAVLAFAGAASVIAGILFGMAPAVHSSRAGLTSPIASGRRLSSGRSPLRSGLVIAEIALTLILLVGAGLLLRSFSNLQATEKGFASDRLVSFDLSASSAKYRTPEDASRFFRNVIERLGHIPGVDGVGVVNELPLSGGGVNGSVPIEGKTYPPGQEPSAEKRIVNPDYFRVMGIRVLGGRTFTDRDVHGSPAVMVVSRSFARRYFGDDTAIGKRAAFNWDMDNFQEIIGVVDDVAHYGLGESPIPMVYVSYLQRPDDTFSVVLRTSSDASTLANAARTEVRAIDPARPVRAARSMDAVIAASLEARRLSLLLVGGFAILGLLLAATGIYSVINYVTRQRMHEFGIRLALGAEPASVIRLVLRQGLVLGGIGLGIGIGGALLLTGLVKGQLFGVTPTDPATFVIVAAGVLAVTLLACYAPARRANRVSPTIVLRSE